MSTISTAFHWERRISRKGLFIVLTSLLLAGYAWVVHDHDNVYTLHPRDLQLVSTEITHQVKTHYLHDTGLAEFLPDIEANALQYRLNRPLKLQIAARAVVAKHCQSKNPDDYTFGLNYKLNDQAHRIVLNRKGQFPQVKVAAGDVLSIWGDKARSQHCKIKAGVWIREIHAPWFQYIAAFWLCLLTASLFTLVAQRLGWVR